MYISSWNYKVTMTKVLLASENNIVLSLQTMFLANFLKSFFLSAFLWFPPPPFPSPLIFSPSWFPSSWSKSSFFPINFLFFYIFQFLFLFNQYFHIKSNLIVFNQKDPFIWTDEHIWMFWGHALFIIWGLKSFISLKQTFLLNFIFFRLLCLSTLWFASGYKTPISLRQN